jgi:uncharacterized protein YqeY
MREVLQSALTEAIKSGDRPAVSALRSALAAIANAEAVEAVESSEDPGVTHPMIAGSVPGVGATEVARRELTEVAQLAIVRAEIDARRSAASGYDQAGRPDRAAALRAEADVLARYLG